MEASLPLYVNLRINRLIQDSGNPQFTHIFRAGEVKHEVPSAGSSHISDEHSFSLFPMFQEFWGEIWLENWIEDPHMKSWTLNKSEEKAPSSKE